MLLRVRVLKVDTASSLGRASCLTRVWDRFPGSAAGKQNVNSESLWPRIVRPPQRICRSECHSNHRMCELQTSPRMPICASSMHSVNDLFTSMRQLLLDEVYR